MKMASLQGSRYDVKSADFSWKAAIRSGQCLFKAIELLSDTYPISEVASILAFSSDSAFATFFKNMTGSTPRAYMENKK